MTSTNVTMEQTEALLLFLTQSEKISKDESNSTQSVKNTNQISYVQAIDTISKSEVAVGSGAALPPSNKGEEAASLTAPASTTDNQLLDLRSYDSTNMFALIGAAMALAAQGNSLAFKVFMQIANSNKEYAADMAPVDGELVEAAANAGAAATRTEAAQATTTAWTNLVGGISMLGIGTVMGLNDLEVLSEETPKKPVTLDSVASKAESMASEVGEDAASKTSSDAVTSAMKETSPEQKGVKGFFSNAYSKLKNSKMESFAKITERVFGLSMGIQTGMAIPINFNDAKNKTEQANQQEKQGVAQAAEKVVEQGSIAYSNTTTQQYVSNYGAMDKNVDSSTQNWESAVQAITQGFSKLWQA